jgi:glycosyltransferase involved in cell wall biosynthesis
MNNLAPLCFDTPPLVSIITASYNYAAFLAEAMDSVLAQSYPHWELIVVDDGSKDDSVAVIEAYAQKDERITLHTHEGGVNKGLIATVQLGLAHAKGPLVAFLESDDLWEPHALEHRLAVFRQHPTLAFLFNEVAPFGDELGCQEVRNYQQRRAKLLVQDVMSLLACQEVRTSWHRRARRSETARWPRPVGLLFLFENIVPTFSCITLRTEALRACNFESPFAPWLDWWLYTQLASHYPFYFLNEPLTLWRKHASSYIRNTHSAAYEQAPRFLDACHTLLRGAPTCSSPLVQLMLCLTRTERRRKFFRGLIRQLPQWYARLG